MTFPHGFPGSPPPYPDPSTNASHPHRDPMFMLGAIFERTDRLVAEWTWVRHRLEQGADQFQKHEGRISTVEAKVEAALRAKPAGGDEIPKWERTLKRWAAWLVPLAVGLWTGQIQSAIELLKLLK